MLGRIPPLPTVSDILRLVEIGKSETFWNWIINSTIFRIYNIRAKKQLSQNFIMDPRLLKRIAEVII